MRWLQTCMRTKEASMVSTSNKATTTRSLHSNHQMIITQIMMSSITLWPTQCLSRKLLSFLGHQSRNRSSLALIKSKRTFRIQLDLQLKKSSKPSERRHLMFKHQVPVITLAQWKSWSVPLSKSHFLWSQEISILTSQDSQFVIRNIK